MPSVYLLQRPCQPAVDGPALARPLVVAYDPYLSRAVRIESEPPPVAREA
jgi:hypothetical protein